MALRVLLADESVTIKKVIQLALQDFAVEVKAVPVGLDVLEVSKSFQPDLVFADILLQKRSGYEVCADLKKDPTTAAIPVVLMWSSFMELDQRQVDSCGADGRLEKPFEVEALRKLVLELVPRTRSQRLAHFLDYPATVAAPLRQETKPPPPKPKEESITTGSLRMPPPLVTKPAAKPPPANPFGAGLGAGPEIENPIAKSIAPTPVIPTAKPTHPLSVPKPPISLESEAPYSGPPTDFTITPGIPERPTAPQKNPTEAEAPLGALPDLQLEGTSSAPSSGAGGWNMESFEPLDLGPLAMADDDDENESFKPIQLPQAESASHSFPMNLNTTNSGAKAPPELSLDSDDDADQWANRSLDKYRMPPLKPDESLAVDEMSPDFAATHQEPDTLPTATNSMSGTTEGRGQFEFNPATMPSLTTDKTEIIVPTVPRQKPVEPPPADDEIREFSLSDDDFDSTSTLEIEHVSQQEKTRPAIVRELLRDPDFSFGEETVRQPASDRSRSSASDERTLVQNEGAIDLSSAGKPSTQEIDQRRVEEMIQNQLTPQLEKIIEKVIEKTVSQMLPQIAERIIKRELERLLEET